MVGRLDVYSRHGKPAVPHGPVLPAHRGLQMFALVCAGNAIATTELGTGMHFWNIDAANETALWKVSCPLTLRAGAQRRRIGPLPPTITGVSITGPAG